MACRDAEPWLGVQLAALARQQCPEPWELLVCDNGSTDGTVALAESWTGRLPVRVIDASAVQGSGPARNAGAEATRAEWLAFCDADDEIGEGWLAAVCTALAAHPFVAGPFEDARLNTERVRRSRPNPQREGLQYLTPGIGFPHAGTGNLAIHRSVFGEVGGFDPQVGSLQDTDLCWRVQLAGHELAFVPEMLVHVRLRSTWRGMFRQGLTFGAAQARLERRHAGAGHPRQAGRPATSPVAAATRVIVRGLRVMVDPWAQLWQLGWHLGYRRG